MRAGICTVQQALTPEATTMVKQAVSLAKRRGHAQVTPLHVASAMLATSNGLLRKACLQCHSHPLQCKALELCFNVALNRLPASNSSPILAPHYPIPSFSNALVAAFKRAQAHQRRGSIENQQQPILALKIELEQLIISILDDPSVSRVMREAGFSSTLVKNRVEQSVSLEICTRKSSPPTSNNSLPPNNHYSKESQASPSTKFPAAKPFEQIRNDDVMSVLNIMLNKRRNMVVVGESLGTAENVAKGVMEKFDTHGDHFRYNLQFVNLPLSSLRSLSKEEVEQKLVELRCLVMKSYMVKGFVLYLGDLSWVSEFWSNYSEKRRNSAYSAAEQIITELKRLVSGLGDNGRLWLMGIATFQTYQKCKIGYPSLEAIWELHPLTLPVGGLSLSLNFERDVQAEMSTRETKHGSAGKQLSCCADCTEKFDKEVQSIQPFSSNTHNKSSLPSWLQKCREATKRSTTVNIDQECITVTDLCKKWNSFCSSSHKHPEKALINISSSPSSSNSFSWYESNLNFNPNQTQLPPPPSSSPPKEYQFWVLDNSDDQDDVKVFIPDHANDNIVEPKPELLSNPNSSPNSASSSEVIMEDTENLQSFKQLNQENIKILTDEMEKKADWQRDIIPEIARAILECRSGLRKRRGSSKHNDNKEESWLFFLGDDSKGKEMIARTLAKLIFGSQNNFLSIGISSFSSTKIESNKEIKRKRTRDEMGSSYLQRFGEAVNENPHRVFFMEDLEQVDCYSQKGIINAIRNGRIRIDGGEFVPLKDAIVIFSSESFSTTTSSDSRVSSPTRNGKKCDGTVVRGREEEGESDELEDKRSLPCVSLDLNIAIEDDHKSNGEEEQEENGGGILESVDMKIVFNISQQL